MSNDIEIDNKILKRLISILKNNDNIQILNQFLGIIEKGQLDIAIENIKLIEDGCKNIQEIEECVELRKENIDNAFFDIFKNKDDNKDNDEEDYYSDKIDAINDATDKAHKIISRYNQLIDRKNDANGEIIYGVLTKIEKAHEKINKLENNIMKFEDYYNKIFIGIDNKIPLKEYIEKQQVTIEETIKNANNQFSELENKIEQLLPGATTAGLSTAYEEQRKAAEQNIGRWKTIFTISVGMFICIFAGYFYMTFNENFSYISIFKSLPIWIFSGFFTYYSTKQIDEYKKIANEYRHKESLSKTYVGFEKIINEKLEVLDQEQDGAQSIAQKEIQELKNKLLNISLDSIKVNPGDKINLAKGSIPSVDVLKKLIDALPTDTLNNISKYITNKINSIKG